MVVHRMVALLGSMALAVSLTMGPVGAAGDAEGWSVVPNPTGSGETYLYDVAALSSTEAWAVGEAIENGDEVPLLERWDGVRWVRQSRPEVADAYLYGVDAVSTSDVWAVGHQDLQQYTSRSVIEHWTGSEWTRIPSPNPSRDPAIGRNELYDVVALASDDAWAVGYFITQDVYSYSELLAHWDGTRWRPQWVPRRGYRPLISIDAVSADDIWAVGQQLTADETYAALIERWDGSRWSRVASPDIGATAYLTGVAAVAADDVWAVGYRTDETTSTTLIEHWNGISWTVVPAPMPSQAYLQDVAAVAPDDVWAVGYVDSGLNVLTLTLHWDGVAWSIVDSPNGRGALSALYSTASDGLGGAWAVGVAYPVPLVIRTT